MQIQDILKKLSVFSLAFYMVHCGSSVKRKPSDTYMPDMYYSRAYETYSSTKDLANKGIKFNPSPVEGTINREESLLLYYPLQNTSEGYVGSANIKNPIVHLNQKDFEESERLFLINCAICHGDKLDGNGPLYRGGDGPYPVKPATLVGDVKYESMPEGTIFHSIKYGKNLMGSYSSQLTNKQAWMITKYIKIKQNKK